MFGGAHNRRKEQPRSRLLSATIVAGLALSACGGDEYDPDSLGAQALSDLSPIEVEVLRDKVVTQEDREAGANTVATCLTEAGFEDVRSNSRYPVSKQP